VTLRLISSPFIYPILIDRLFYVGFLYTNITFPPTNSKYGTINWLNIRTNQYFTTIGLKVKF